MFFKQEGQACVFTSYFYNSPTAALRDQKASQSSGPSRVWDGSQHLFGEVKSQARGFPVCNPAPGWLGQIFLGPAKPCGHTLLCY